MLRRSWVVGLLGLVACSEHPNLIASDSQPLDENAPPNLGPIGNRLADANFPIAFQVVGLDTDAGQELTLSAEGLPPGATFATVSGTSPLTQTFTWMPSLGQVGRYVITFTVTDADGSAATFPSTF